MEIYDAIGIARADKIGQLEYATEEGFRKGMEKGMEKGIEKGIEKGLKKMIDGGIPELLAKKIFWV